VLDDCEVVWRRPAALGTDFSTRDRWRLWPPTPLLPGQKLFERLQHILPLAHRAASGSGV